VNPTVILLAEDRDDVRLAIWNLLKASGFTVLAAGDGIAALEASRNYAGTIDLLLSDMDMPRMGGLELCQTIATERPGIKVLIMSGGLQELEHVYMKGMQFLQKPLTSTALRGSIQALLV
jgi:CheY-like chemotaxis protein